MSEREAVECAKFGEVLRWSSDSEGETEKTTRADKDLPVATETEAKVTQIVQTRQNTIVLITETEEAEEIQQASVSETIQQTVKVAKQFEAGLFIGEITAVNTKRGRNLYTVLYEDGDGEDMNDREYKEARDLYEKTQGVSRNTNEIEKEAKETEDEPLHSGGETEGSEFAPSDDEVHKIRRKTKRQKPKSPEKEKEKTKRRKTTKEVETKGRKQ
jgi:hypothetical protein